MLSRREFARLGAAGTLGVGISPVLEAAQAGTVPAAAAPRPDVLKSEFLMDLILETGGGGSGSVGNRSIVSVNAGTFEGPKLKGKVLPPGADWPLRIDDTLRILDVRTVLMTDDEQRIYMTYRGIIYTPPQGQGERYWRTTPAFETASTKYTWLNHVIAVGVAFTIPQRVCYRIFQIL
jgi:hypothetical protein